MKYPVSEFVREEMDARGWTMLEMARRMGGDDLRLNLCLLDFILNLNNPDVFLGVEAADALARAFGVSAELFLNIDKSWREYVLAQR